MLVSIVFVFGSMRGVSKDIEVLWNGNKPRMTLIGRIYTDLIRDDQSNQCHPWSISALTGDIE
jgi:hypothetical protein